MLKHAMFYVAAMLGLAPSIVGAADVVPAGPQLHVAGPPARFFPSIAVRSDGRFVVGWNTIGDPYTPFARIYGSDGSALTGELQIADQGEGIKLRFTSENEILAVWYVNAADRAVFARRYTADGVSLGAAVRVDGGTGPCAHPELAGGEGSSTLVVFRTCPVLVVPTRAFLVSRRLGTDGLPLGDPVVVVDNPAPAVNVPDSPKVAVRAGGFLLTWLAVNWKFSFPYWQPDSVNATVRSLDANGAPASPESRISPDDDTYVHAVTSLADGTFVAVTKNSVGNFYPPLVGQRLSSSGARMGSSVPMTASGEYAADPSLASRANGFVMVWNGQSGIDARAFDSSFVPVSDPVAVNESVSDESRPAAAMSPSGRLVAAWVSSTPQGDSIEARSFDLRCTDGDSDGYAVDGGPCGSLDCNDDDPLVNPAATEIPGDGIDNDCNSTTPGGCSPALAEAATVPSRRASRMPLDFAVLVGLLGIARASLARRRA